MLDDRHSLDIGCNLFIMHNGVLIRKSIEAKDKIKWFKTRLIVVEDNTKVESGLQMQFKMEIDEQRKKINEYEETLERVQKALDVKTKQSIEHLKRESNALKEKG